MNEYIQNDNSRPRAYDCASASPYSEGVLDNRVFGGAPSPSAPPAFSIPWPPDGYGNGVQPGGIGVPGSPYGQPRPPHPYDHIATAPTVPVASTGWQAAQAVQATYPPASHYGDLISGLNELLSAVKAARSQCQKAMIAEGADAGENLLPLSDGLGTLVSAGATLASHALTMKANEAVQHAKNIEQRVCGLLQSGRYPTYAQEVTHGKRHLRLGQHRAIFRVNGWFDTITDFLCCFGGLDLMSWYLTWRMNGVRNGLEQLENNTTRLLERVYRDSATAPQASAAPAWASPVSTGV